MKTAEDFTMMVASYWARIAENEAILDAIEESVRKCSPAALKAIYKKMQELFPPGKAVGVSDVVEGAKESGSSLRAYIPKSFSVICDGCEATYNYVQGGGHPEKEIHPTDVCPYCGLAYHDTFVMKEYAKRGGVPKEFQGYYARELKRASDRLKNGVPKVDPDKVSLLAMLMEGRNEDHRYRSR